MPLACFEPAFSMFFNLLLQCFWLAFNLLLACVKHTFGLLLACLIACFWFVFLSFHTGAMQCKAKQSNAKRSEAKQCKANRNMWQFSPRARKAKQTKAKQKKQNVSCDSFPIPRTKQSKPWHMTAPFPQRKQSHTKQTVTCVSFPFQQARQSKRKAMHYSLQLSLLLVSDLFQFELILLLACRWYVFSYEFAL